MNCRALSFALPLVLLIVIPGCGSRFNENNVSVTVSPATATVAAGGQVTLHATVHGLHGCSSCPPPFVSWSITENGSGLCDQVNNMQPAGPCPAGTIQGDGTPDVTYFAPSTSGTFHVVAEWCDCIAKPVVSKTATAVITVN